MKYNAYQGKRKVKDRWSETEYVVVCQVTDGIPAYEVKDEVGNVKTIHCNQLFLVATPKEAIMPLGAGMSISEENVQSTRVEHASDLPMGGRLLRCGELRWITHHPQDVEPSQIVDV